MFFNPGWTCFLVFVFIEQGEAAGASGTEETLINIPPTPKKQKPPKPATSNPHKAPQKTSATKTNSEAQKTSPGKMMAGAHNMWTRSLTKHYGPQEANADFEDVCLSD